MVVLFRKSHLPYSLEQICHGLLHYFQLVIGKMFERFFIFFFNSYLIYTISKERDKSGDSAFTDIIEKFLKESGIRGVVVNGRINIFRKKISLLLSQASAARKKGVHVFEGFSTSGKQTHIRLSFSTTRSTKVLSCRKTRI